MIDTYWNIIKVNYWKIQQQLFTWCANKGIVFLMDDFNQAMLQAGEGIIKGYWKKELDYDNVKNYLFITFRNINYLKLNDVDTNSIEDTIYEDIKVGDTIATDDEEYIEDETIEIESVYNFIRKEFGEDKLKGFENKLLHKQSTIKNDEYLHILWVVRKHFYPNVDKWNGEYEKTLENKKKLKEWRKEHPSATRKEYLDYYTDLNYDIIKNHSRDYYYFNIDKIKAYRENHKEYFNEYSRNYWKKIKSKRNT